MGYFSSHSFGFSSPCKQLNPCLQDVNAGSGIYTDVGMYVCMYVCIHTIRIFVYVYIHLYVEMCTYTCCYSRVYLCMYLCVHIYICIYTPARHMHTYLSVCTTSVHLLHIYTSMLCLYVYYVYHAYACVDKSKNTHVKAPICKWSCP